MARKLDNAAWTEYINKFDSYKGSITVKDFCIGNELTKSQFYYHKRRLGKIETESKEAIFHAISLDNKVDKNEGNNSVLNLVKR